MADKKPYVWVSVLATVLIAGLGAGGYLWQTQKQPQKPAGPLQKIVIGVSATSLLPSLIHIAAGKGFFLEEGLDVEVRGFPTGKHALQATLKKEIDMGTVAGPPIVANSFERNDFAIVATILDSAQHAKVLARKDRNINNSQDLADKKVATTLGTTAHFYMHAFFTMNEIDSSNVEVVNLKPKQMVDAIAHGDVDAVFTWEPNITKGRKILGDNAIVLPNVVGYKATFNLVAMRDFIAAKPKILSKTLRALVKAEKFIKENRKDSVGIVSSFIKADKVVTEKLWDIYRFRLTLSQQLLLILEDQARWAIDADLTDKEKIPNFLDYIYQDALDEVNPIAITIIR